MQLAIVQPLADARLLAWACRDEVAFLAAALRQKGHTLSMLMAGPREEEAVASAMSEPRPEVVLMYVEALAADVAARAAGAIASVLGAPVIPFGPHARLCPGACLSMGGAEAVAVGPADFTIPAYLEARGGSLDSSRAAGMWVKLETGVMRNPPPRPPASLDDQPPPARDIYPPEVLLDPAGFASAAFARWGEADICAVDAAGVTTAPWAEPWPVRHLPVDTILAEMAEYARVQMDLGGWRLGNSRWLALPSHAEEFADKYRKQFRLPLRTVVHAPDVTDATAAALATARCEEAVVPVGSASNFIRNEVLRMGVDAESIVSAFRALIKAGVPVTARVDIGAPYETSVTLDETAALLSRLQADRVQAVLHYPAPGSQSERLGRENGWLAPDPATAMLAGRPAVLPPGLAAEDIADAAELMPYQVLRPRLAPLLRMARRLSLGKRGTVYDVLVKPLLAPPARRRKQP